MKTTREATIWSPVPLRAAGISLFCLAAAVVGSLRLQNGWNEYAVLPWLPALIPAFLLSYYRGWRGAAIALELGMIALVGAEVLHRVIGVPGLDTPLLAIVLLLLILASFGGGWVTELLHQQRVQAERNASEVIMVLAADGTLLRVSPAIGRVLGYAPRDVIGQRIFDLMHPDDAPAVRTMHERAVGIPGQREEVDVRFRNREGEWRVLECMGQNLLDDPRVKGVVVGARDVTARRDLEEQLNQAQRLESVGRLTGGIAHDFNNILTAITAESEFLLEETAADDHRRGGINAIVAAAARARDLTRQLLAFSRQQVLTTQRIDLDDLVPDVMRMLRRTIRENVVTHWEDTGGLEPVLADPTQIRQVVINLVVNAADAMPDGGRLEVRAGNRRLDPAFCASFPYQVLPGEYVELVVSDTGTGIAPEVLEHVFEPFYTTKGQEGTGLGLSTVYGIVKQSGGYVWVESELAVGTTVRVLLPVDRTAPQPVRESAPRPPEEARARRILVVEDDPAVRDVIQRTLLRAGHAVVVAESGLEALEILEGIRGVDLLLTDVVMPGISGVELARRAQDARPDLEVVLVSGYTRHEIREVGLQEHLRFLPKPFTPAELLAAVSGTPEEATVRA